jgi:hypothetical protein
VLDGSPDTTIQPPQEDQLCEEHAGERQGQTGRVDPVPPRSLEYQCCEEHPDGEGSNHYADANEVWAVGLEGVRHPESEEHQVTGHEGGEDVPKADEADSVDHS